MQRLVDKRNKVPTPSLHNQKTAIRASLGSAIRTSKPAIRDRFHNRSVIRRFCKIRESVQFFNEIRESVAILGQIRRSASLFTPPPLKRDGYFRMFQNESNLQTNRSETASAFVFFKMT